MKRLPTYKKLPSWVTDYKHRETRIHGAKWFCNPHIMLRLSGTTNKAFNPALKVMKSKEVTNANVSLRPRGVDRHEGLWSDTFTIAMGNGTRMALSYYALVTLLYGHVAWFGTHKRAPLIAKRDGDIVAVVMGVIPPRKRRNS